jgi:hypothetical protein
LAVAVAAVGAVISAGRALQQPLVRHKDPYQ